MRQKTAHSKLPRNQCPLPFRKYLDKKEAADYVGVCEDSFDKFDIPFSDLGPRLKRWDVADIDAFMYNKKSDWAPNTNERIENSWSRKNEKEVKTTISTGAMNSDNDIAKVLELPIKS